MIPLKRTRAFHAVSRRGRWARSASLAIGALPTSLAEFRVGLRTPRSAGTAAARNRLKRQLRGLLRRHAAHLRAGVDLVIVLRPRTGPEQTKVLERELTQLCRKVGAWQS